MAAAVLAAALVALLGVARSVPVQASASVHITATGDYATTTQASATLNLIASLAPDAHLALGDLSYDERPETDWCNFVKARVGEGFPFELVAGNHESNGQHGHINNFSSCLPNQMPGAVGTYGREYYFDLPKGNPLVRVIMASPQQVFPGGTWDYSPGSNHHEWTVDAIDTARAVGIPWVVVGTHYPCLGVSAYDCVMGRDFFDLMVEKDVDLVMVGHDHNYQRTHQLSTGEGCQRIPVGSFDADCVADTGDTYYAGQGTVFATVGTGGVSLRDIDPTNPEYGYVAAASGANADPTWGVLDIKASQELLEASFARSAGGGFADSFRISNVPVPNEPPVARFTTTQGGLTVVVDATDSSDPDGTIQEYAWDFGDGATDSGRAPAPHTYDAPGTYPITLTVTDDDGAADSIAQDVTVSEPQGGEPPVKPTGLTATASGQTVVDLAWDPVPGATSYTVIRDGEAVGSSTTADYGDSGLVPATGYTYRVAAVNSNGQGPPSDAVSVTTRNYAVSGDTWRYNDTGADLGTSWVAEDYPDQSWTAGPTEAGYGDGDEATVLSWGSVPYAKPITNYFRLTFDAGEDISGVTALDLRAVIDDSALVRLNGQEIWRFNLPTGNITYTTRASRYIAGSAERQWHEVRLPATALQPGTNTLAVEVHQDAPSSSDVSFNLELRPVG